MSTPTHSHKYPAHTTVHNAPTPSNMNHLGAFPSPAPRSVPSPAAYRNQAGKSPMNPSTMPQSLGTAQNHLSSSSATASKGLVGSSPAGLNYDSPSGLGLGLGSLGGLDGGVGMGISMSGMSGLGLGMGLTNSLSGRPDDTERRKRLETIIATLGARPGRPTKENLIKLARKLGITASEHEGGVFLGDTGVGIDVSFKDGMISNKMEVDFNVNLSQTVRNWSASASKVLNDDISPRPGLAAINLTLDKISRNLDRLFHMDKISTFKGDKKLADPDVHCFDAIGGVYTSLNRLFEHEKKAASTLIKASTEHRNEKAEREVLCKKSGRPRMNVNGTLGLSLEYWMDRRHAVCSRASTEKDPDQGMDFNGNDETASVDDSNRIFSLTIECEQSSAQLYPPIRVSDEWVSEKIEIEHQATDPSDIWPSSSIDWRDPPPTYLDGGDATQADPMALDGSNLGKLPNVRFVAKLNPPLVVPFNTAQQILASVGVQMQQDAVRWSTLEALVLKPNEDPAAMGADSWQHQALQKVLIVDQDGEEQERLHTNTLFVQRTEYARVLDEIPFHHPRQLVQMLPILRQYAFLTTLLEYSFGSPGATQPSLLANSTEATRPVSVCINSVTPNPQIIVNTPRAGGIRLPDPLDDFLGLDIDFSQPALASYGLSILPNADIALLEQDALPELQPSAVTSEDDNETREENEGKLKKLGRLGKVLEMCGDVGMWVEWVEMMAARGS
ncbi:hypothetical protein K490DRAFT_61416 [Saccharata proteae CBS 121410]|uniref:Mediator of RNA polymerase II transcription subunit 1 n=1 Tax=Saccharata proteae CBS 121410 TaxID=1314787 RepID=A0A9P4I1W4_9PEZI|nr:hypothetical protein K490DRAFT_61416 [Saccharata proteae CBS 121410]